MVHYPTEYSDVHGTRTTIIENDGHTLRMMLRGIEFSGIDFHSFEAPAVSDPSQLESFPLFLNGLCSYTLECTIPIMVVDGRNTLPAGLRVHVERGKPVEWSGRTVVHRKDGSVLEANQQIDREVLRLELLFQTRSFVTSGKNKCYSFEEQLEELKDLLPKGIYLKICWNCAYSDYDPAGSGIFGDLACFRDARKQYLRVKSKRDMFEIWGAMTEHVQETHLCPEFKKRKPGTGYRG